MKRIPTLFISTELENLFTLFTRTDYFDNVYYYVEYFQNDGSLDFARFDDLSSALDFIHSKLNNFKLVNL